MSDTEDDQFHHTTVKITILGEPFTGKSSLCQRYLSNSPRAPGGTTHGAEVLAGQCLGLRPPVPLHLCDVAGNSLSTGMLRNYLYASDVVLFVYDLSNLQSFDKLNVWIEKVKEIFDEEPKKPLMALFGNKSDLEHQRAVRLSCVKQLASKYLLENFKGSARTGEMVNYAFTDLIARVLRLPVPSSHVTVPIKLETELELSKDASQPDGVPTSPLIMNRKTLRKIQRKASSSICSVQ
ncbi:PREDICTED: ras-related protein Rab-28-like [Papilio xuthus]|uniref:Ras-related protein Rab-28-like n=1 Tax=Papilio xuthus TaxID=66420 RepID=A0AAJ6Z4L5_PAPXU|nr:PREDICTED: ras-related protein Rab-28-like [Papilio xuthus]